MLEIYAAMGAVFFVVSTVAMKVRLERGPDWLIGGARMDNSGVLLFSSGMTLIWPLATLTLLTMELGSRIGARAKARRELQEQAQQEIQHALESLEEE